MAERTVQVSIDETGDRGSSTSSKVMSWEDHVKTHDRRRRAAEVLSSVQGLKICYVSTVKAAHGPAVVPLRTP